VLTGIVENLLNRNLGASPRARELCAALRGRRLVIVMSGTPLCIAVESTGDTLRVTRTAAGAGTGARAGDGNTAGTAANTTAGAAAGDFDVEVVGTPVNLLALTGSEPEALLQRGAITMRGDVDLAQRYRELALLLKPDLEEELSRFLGDAPAHQLMRLAMGAVGFGRRAASTATLNAAEYLAHETRDLVPRAEAEVFLAGVDRLREDVDRCAARLEHLEQRLAATAALRDGAGAGAGVQPDAGPAGGGRAHHDASRGPR